MVVADVVANPAETRFLEEARERGCTTLDGLGMLVNQGAINMRHWTGVDPDREAMRRAVAEAFHGAGHGGTGLPS
jgi:shikimate dehydrogenase